MEKYSLSHAGRQISVAGWFVRAPNAQKGDSMSNNAKKVLFCLAAVFFIATAYFVLGSGFLLTSAVCMTGGLLITAIDGKNEKAAAEGREAAGEELPPL